MFPERSRSDSRARRIRSRPRAARHPNAPRGRLGKREGRRLARRHRHEKLPGPTPVTGPCSPLPQNRQPNEPCSLTSWVAKRSRLDASSRGVRWPNTRNSSSSITLLAESTGCRCCLLWSWAECVIDFPFWQHLLSRREAKLDSTRAD